mmetsp:Transcript_30544/g.75837  ORF Transcript_30544/g.75837 Transcript_30544/m.75837 type:complete len:241 (-) Transcript_30544:155-877(-)
MSGQPLSVTVEAPSRGLLASHVASALAPSFPTESLLRLRFSRLQLASSLRARTSDCTPASDSAALTERSRERRAVQEGRARDREVRPLSVISLFDKTTLTRPGHELSRSMRLWAPSSPTELPQMAMDLSWSAWRRHSQMIDTPWSPNELHPNSTDFMVRHCLMPWQIARRSSLAKRSNISLTWVGVTLPRSSDASASSSPLSASAILLTTSPRCSLSPGWLPCPSGASRSTWPFPAPPCA